jgi:hypothetical protein
VFTVTNTASVPVHPFIVFVTVTVYVVLTLGVAIGFATVVLLKPDAGNQAYVLPAIAVVPIVVEVVVHVKILFNPASATGDTVFTFTVTTSCAVQPFTVLVTVTVYVVVVLGLAIGLLIVVLLKPVLGLQLYVLPATVAAPIVPLVVKQFKVISAPALAIGANVFTFTTTTSVAVQPFTVLVTVTV